MSRINRLRRAPAIFVRGDSRRILPLPVPASVRAYQQAYERYQQHVATL